MKIYTFLIPFVLGVFLTIFVYQAMTIYELRSAVSADHTTITQIVNFLNTQTKPAQGTTKPVESANPTR